MFELINEIKDRHRQMKERADNIHVEEKQEIPKEEDIQLETGKCYQIRNVTALYYDLCGSTNLSDISHATTMAKIYEFFTGAYSSFLRLFEADYKEMHGDGGYGLWRGVYGDVRALLTAVTFKTYLEKLPSSYLPSNIKEIQGRAGIARGTVLVKKVGERNTGNHRQNWLVWSGKPLNKAAELCKKTKENTIAVEEKVKNVFKKDEFKDYLYKSCDCGRNSCLWTEEPENYLLVDEPAYYCLKTIWCINDGTGETGKGHGIDYINAVFDIIRRN